MFRQWLCIGLLVLIGTPLWAQDDRAVRRNREEMVSAQRVALVIGNKDYTGSLRPLKNPVNDAKGMAKVLKEIGFEVIAKYDATREEIGAAIHKFSQRIGNHGIALFYFSGHGLQVDGINYLVPVNAQIKEEYQVPYQCNSANEVLSMLEKRQGTRINLVILDACRNNPFASGDKSIERRGLAEMQASGSLIAYATSPDGVADDGDGTHSPYTESLIKHIKTPGLEIVNVFKEVGKEVKEVTFGDQEPWRQSNVNKDFYLVPSVVPPSVVTTIASPPPFPLHEAAGLNRTEEVLRLLMRGTEVNTRDNTGQTPLHTAARFDAHATAELLLNQHADANLQDNADQTPLHIAARYKADQVAELLLSRGAEADVRDNSGRTPLDIANSSQAEEIIEVLRHYSKMGAQPLEVGRVFKDCADCPEMVVVPSGSFTMGSPSSEEGRDDDEGPRHLVTIDYPFAVGVYEVTFSEWDACVADGGCGGYVPDDKGWGRGNRPVMNVSWNHAQSYVRWLSSKTGHNYGLLSESEWEYVARAGTTTPFHFGTTISTDQANYSGDYGRKGVYRSKTLPVGSFRANVWGVHDIHGNVWEWVQDCWNDSYVGAPVDGSSWESGDCGRRVVRGGSWYYAPRYLRSADRSWDATEVRDSSLGFRIARRF